MLQYPLSIRSIPVGHLGKHADRSDPRLEREGRLAGISALGAPTAVRDRGSASSPRCRFLRVLSAVFDPALEPADPDRCDGLAGGDRHPRTYRRGHPAAAQGHSSRARSPRAAGEPRPAPLRLAPPPGDLLGRVDASTPRTEPGVSGATLRRRARSAARPAPSLLRRSRVGHRARGSSVPRFPGSGICRETGGDLPGGRSGGHRDRLRVVGADTPPALRGQYQPGRQGGALPGALDRRDSTRVWTCGRGRAPVRPQGANHVRRHQARPKSARQRPALGHEHPASPDAAALKQDAVLPARTAHARRDTVWGRFAPHRHRRARARCRSRAGGRTRLEQQPPGLHPWLRRIPVLGHSVRSRRRACRRTTGRFPSGSHASTSADSSRTRRIGWP